MKLAHKNVGVGLSVCASTHMKVVKFIYLAIHPSVACIYNMYSYLSIDTIQSAVLELVLMDI